ncbi:hypothetical protein EIP91_003592 [Steccherinum ochraceum]|uniref:Uncharacterized protein n=1 Tax=Steccherinum ochraceum TaxID=92696 RepID=A0A4R0RA89_9APHY|nr:hypothetical protein EIP91_003592 [Steccherinum ochraceum]
MRFFTTVLLATLASTVPSLAASIGSVGLASRGDPDWRRDSTLALPLGATPIGGAIVLLPRAMTPTGVATVPLLLAMTLIGGVKSTVVK